MNIEITEKARDFIRKKGFNTVIVDAQLTNIC